MKKSKPFQIYLRPYQKEDARAYARGRTDSKLTLPYLGFEIEASKKKSIVDNFENSPEFQEPNAFAISLTGTKEFIGAAGLHDYCQNDNSAELFYYLLPKYWGNGYAKEAVNLVCKHAFLTLKLNRIEANTAEKNYGSIKVLEKCSFIKEGVKRESRKVNGEYENMVVYSMLNSEFQNEPKEKE